MISFNKGGHWSTLDTPSGEECEGCTLHLFGPSASYQLENQAWPPGWQSPETLPGVVAAIGQVMPTEGVFNDTSLYISYDAGSSWTKSIGGVDTFTLNPYGTLSLANEQTGDDLIHYSFDTGLTWSECTINTTAIVYDGDESQFDWEFHIVGLYGDLYDLTVETQQDRRWGWLEVMYNNYTRYMVHIDFLEEDETIPLCEPEDYELYLPNNGECVLGQIAYHRRHIASHSCIPEEDLIGLYNVTACECTREDYYCSFCFVEDPDTKECIPDTIDDYCETLWDPTPPPVNCTSPTTYTGAPAYYMFLGSLALSVYNCITID
eukprot:TRINITY_DN45_c1_g3_i3.p1 TRINITY_DN45_c1_g3~~TRINITY_DN45_c1_g3_i3.p1  ORF type:complete len:369 (-),score=61.36 TRINITY_DN45_c1_g3_i3:683-1642(-)